jgi:hypothetical protein
MNQGRQKADDRENEPALQQFSSACGAFHSGEEAGSKKTGFIVARRRGMGKPPAALRRPVRRVRTGTNSTV